MMRIVTIICRKTFTGIFFHSFFLFPQLIGVETENISRFLRTTLNKLLWTSIGNGGKNWQIAQLFFFARRCPGNKARMLDIHYTSTWHTYFTGVEEEEEGEICVGEKSCERQIKLFPENLGSIHHFFFFEDAACHCTSPRQLSSKHNRQLGAPMEAQETQCI